MARNKLTCDRTEILGAVNRMVDNRGMMKEKKTRMSLIYDQIKTINFVRYEEKKLFKRIPSERILIFERKSPYPYYYKKIEDEEYFEGYKESLREFAKRNRVTLIDEFEDKK